MHGDGVSIAPPPALAMDMKLSVGNAWANHPANPPSYGEGAHLKSRGFCKAAEDETGMSDASAGSNKTDPAGEVSCSDGAQHGSAAASSALEVTVAQGAHDEGRSASILA